MMATRNLKPIDGTDMYYATNSPASVIRWRNRYYSVDNGVWFESYNAAGPWVVSVSRPAAVALIPPRYPVYYMKYVDIYDVTPDYVYMGYTPGYLNAYVYGPTVVYGTGYYYRPWYGRYYYARPYTWGFGIRYNPWFGWGFGGGFGWDWFNVSIGFGSAYPWNYWGYGGWWGGPSVYRPCYYGPSYHYRGGYYGYNSYRSYRQYNNVTIVNNYYSNTNIYRNRNGIVTRDYGRGGYDRGPRYGGGGRGGYPGGRMGFADNGGRSGSSRFDRNGRSDVSGSARGIYNPQNGTYNRDRLTRPNNSGYNGYNRDVRTPDNGQRLVRPQGSRERFGSSTPSNGGSSYNRDWNSVPGRSDRLQQPQDRQPVRPYDRPNGSGWSQPQRMERPGFPFQGNYGGGNSGGNRTFSPPSRPAPSQGGGGNFGPRGGGNGGGSRPQFGGGNNGGGGGGGRQIRRPG